MTAPPRISGGGCMRSYRPPPEERAKEKTERETNNRG